MNHIRISIQANEQQQEILISELSELNASGFEQTDTHLLAYFNEEDFKSYEANAILEGYTIQVDVVPQQNWNALWESNFEPVVVDDFCGVRAHFHEPISNVEHEIVITPKMSFGTGHHATTYMMMQQMRDIDFTNKSVFDFGTGTGILAILAKRLGASEITAIDVDDWSIENASENFDRNDTNGVQLYQSSIVPKHKFSVVLANINKNVLLQNAEALASCLNENGVLLMSGLLKEDEADIKSAFHALKLTSVKTFEKGAWISVLLVS
jgi:ribosomal protein L11 methyltransferase